MSSQLQTSSAPCHFEQRGEEPCQGTLPLLRSTCDRLNGDDVIPLRENPGFSPSHCWSSELHHEKGPNSISCLSHSPSLNCIDVGILSLPDRELLWNKQAAGPTLSTALISVQHSTGLQGTPAGDHTEFTLCLEASRGFQFYNETLRRESAGPCDLRGHVPVFRVSV